MSSSIAPARSAVKVTAETDRFGQPFDFLDAWFNVTLSGKDTGGAASSVDTDRRMRGDPPTHVHPAQDERFVVREGEFDIKVGDEVFHLLPGDSLLAQTWFLTGASCSVDRSKGPEHLLEDLR